MNKEPRPEAVEAVALRKLFFAKYYLSQRSYDAYIGWTDKADHEAFELLYEKLNEVVNDATERAKQSVRELKEVVNGSDDGTTSAL